MYAYLRIVVVAVALVALFSQPLQEFVQRQVARRQAALRARDVQGQKELPPSPPPQPTQEEAPPWLSSGSDRTDSLDATSVLADGRPYDEYRIACEPDRSYAIDVISAEFDAFAQLLSAERSVILEDDDSGGLSNPRLLASCPGRTVYRLVVTIFAPGGPLGAYTVRVRESS